MNLRGALIGWWLAVLALAGCATAPVRDAGPDPWRALAVNLTAAQVRARLGAPAEVRPLHSAEGDADIWIYRRQVAHQVDLAPTHTEDVPYFNPMTEQVESMPETAYSQETRTVTEELQLLMYGGKLVSWKSAYRTQRTFE